MARLARPQRLQAVPLPPAPFQAHKGKKGVAIVAFTPFINECRKKTSWPADIAAELGVAKGAGILVFSFGGTFGAN